VAAQGPHGVLRADRVLGDGLAGALAGGAAWIWLLDGTVSPRPDVLTRLTAAAEPSDSLPAPDLLASAVVGGDGSLAEGHAPWFRRRATDLALRAALAHLLPIRAARSGSLLVRADAARAIAPPNHALGGSGAALEWTARLLRDGAGYLVPDSVADAVTPAPWPAQALGRTAREDARVAAAMLTGPAWEPKDRVWLAAEALGRLTRRAAGSARP